MGACVLLLHELSDGDSHYDWLIAPEATAPRPHGPGQADPGPGSGADPPDLPPLIAFRVRNRIDLAIVAAFEAERLSKSCARLVWLNPLLRYAGFEARPAGIRAILPHVDDFLPVHNLETLTDLAHALARSPARDPALALGA